MRRRGIARLRELLAVSPGHAILVALMCPRPRLAAFLFALAALCGGDAQAQTPTRNGAGFGAIYGDMSVDPLTGNLTHLGVAVDDRSGEYFVSASSPSGLPPHVIYKIDHGGVLRATFAQPSVHDASGFGIRDLEFDGQSLLGGSEFGISVFDPAGALVNVILAANGPQTIVQPIRGPVAAQLAVFRAIALDKNGNGGNGSLLVADFGSPIFEIDFAGNVLATYPYQGWSAYGLAIDPITGNPWVYAGANGQIEELDRATMAPTGHRIAPVAAGSPGGLSLASPNAFHHEYWPVRSALVSLTQGAADHVGVQRLHLFQGVLGWNEPRLEVGINGGPTDTGTASFWAGDALDFRIVDPTGTRNGWPVWFVFNVYFDANRDAYTNLSLLLPGAGLLWEHRSLNALSTPSTSSFLITTGAIGATQSWTLPLSMGPANGDLFRIQALYLEPASPQASIASTNEANWQANSGERGIVVAAEGATSFNAGTSAPFWTVRSDALHTHGAITAVEISTIGAAGMGALQRFDIDQNAMNDRFDGGNSATPGFLGTYRNGSAALCGLDFAAPGVYTAPFHLAGESSGVGFSVPPDAAGYTQDLRFVFQAFTPGKTFLFDCDTDGGPPSGADHEGLIVRVTTTNSGVLTGVLHIDPNVPDRAVVWFP